MLADHSVPASELEAQTMRRDTAPANRPNLGPSVQAILERARAAEQQTLAASCAHAAVEARRKRAEQAWLRVSTFLGDRIPRDVRGAALWRHYAELIVALGKVLQGDGWQARVDAVSPASEAKMYALALLRRAMADDLATVEEMVKEATATLWSLGLQADR